MRKTPLILIAEDDPEDRYLVQMAFSEAAFSSRVLYVNDGVDLMDYLHRHLQDQDSQLTHIPDLIILDLNMPRMDGREALRIVKQDPKLCKIPIVVLTTSSASQDIQAAYTLGAAGYITKPVTFSALVDVFKAIGQYWFGIVVLPSF